MKARVNNPADLLKEAKRLDREEAAIGRRRLALAKRLIEAGRALGGEDLQAEAAPKPKRRYTRRRRRAPRSGAVVGSVVLTAPHHGTTARGGRRHSETGWTGTMLKVLTDVNRLLTYPELKAELAKTHIGPRLAASDKGFYGGIAKLEARKQAVRHKGRVGTVAAYEQFMRDVAAGLAKDLPAPNASAKHDSPVKMAALAYLKANPQGVTTGNIVENLAKHPDLNLNGKYGKTAVYNLIARLLKRGVLTKTANNLVLISAEQSRQTGTLLPANQTMEGGPPVVRH